MLLRADTLVHTQGLSESRERAKRLIMAGQVYVRRKGEHVAVLKPGQMLSPDTELFVRQAERYVSRGAYKLETAISVFRLDLGDKVVLDVGASTGGFTDCALQHGARRVYALDVGYGQLDSRLRGDERVVNLERTNIRHAQADIIPEKCDFLVMDCSFISLRTALPPSLKFLRRPAEMVVLVKPQFEVARGDAPKGVVRSPEKRKLAVDGIVDFAARELKLKFLGVEPSGILGPKGNQEYLLYLAYA
ncbi:MAG: TlyA family RNA methyltransferase [Desulfonatronovibrionaceae bacterium]